MAASTASGYAARANASRAVSTSMGQPVGLGITARLVSVRVQIVFPALAQVDLVAVFRVCNRLAPQRDCGDGLECNSGVRSRFVRSGLATTTRAA
jgi:hypothetical protein